MKKVRDKAKSQSKLYRYDPGYADSYLVKRDKMRSSIIGLKEKEKNEAVRLPERKISTDFIAVTPVKKQSAL